MKGGSFRMRMRGFLRKEFLQIRRDPSSILLALVMPVVLLFLFGYGVSLNPTRVPLAVVAADRSPAAAELIARIRLSPYLEPRFVVSAQQAAALLQGGEVDGFVEIRQDFSADLLQRGRGRVQLVVNGVDVNRARLIQGYVRGVVEKGQALRRARGEAVPAGGVRMQPRIRFNAANESRNFLVPGLVVLIMTLIGTLLTALVVAREWERGTMESILVTPLRLGELLLGKIIPYYVLGMLGLLLSVAGARWIFYVPLRGSFGLLLLLSSLFLVACLGLGLAISATVRVQFVAAQIAIIAGFLPAFFLSGLLFDLDSTPVFIRLVSLLIPARYFVAISHTLFLAGNIGSVLWPDSLALLLMAALFLLVARRKLSKRLE
jgi:ABC-2 type transport system permease protein